MLEVHAIAGVALPDAAGLETAGDVVLGHPDLIAAVGEIGRVDELELVGQLLTQRQPCARVGLVGNQCRLDADLAETRGLLQTAAERVPDPSGQIRQRLFLGDLELLAAHGVEGAAGHEHGHDVGLGKGRLRRQGGLGIAGRAGDRDVDVVVARRGVEQQVERREDAPLVHERDHAALHLVAPFVQPDLAALEQGHLSGESGLVRRADHAQAGAGLRARQVVVHENRRRGVDVDVEPQPLEEGIALFGEIELAARGHRRQQTGVEVDVTGQPGFHDRDPAADDEVLVLSRDAKLRIGQAAHVERRIVGEVLGRDAHVDVGDAAVAELHEPEPSSVPPLTSPVSFVRTMRGPSSVMSALMFSAAMLGSSLTALASLSVTVP